MVHWSSQAELLGNLALAMVLGAVVGAERRYRAKDAGIRTHSLVALGSATFTIVSKFGFDDLHGMANLSVDPTRVSAQVVSGIGFLGAGLIFIRRDAVRGLTTASSIWLAAAIGMSAGSGLILIALAATALHFIVTFLLPQLHRVIPSSQDISTTIQISYPDHQGVLRQVMREITDAGWALTRFEVTAVANPETDQVQVHVNVNGRQSEQLLLDRLMKLDTVRKVEIVDT